MFCCSCGTAILPEANYCHECGSRIINQRNGDFENNLPNIIESYLTEVISTLKLLVYLKSIMVLRLHYVHLKENYVNTV